MPVSWGTQWGYVESCDPRKCAVFCKDKRPTAHYATDDKGNEVVGIGAIPAPTDCTKVVLVESEREAYYLAKQAQYTSLIATMAGGAATESRLKLRIEMNTHALRMSKSLTAEQSDTLEKSIAVDQECLTKCREWLAELQDLKRRRAPMMELEDILAVEGDCHVEVILAEVAEVAEAAEAAHG